MHKTIKALFLFGFLFSQLNALAQQEIVNKSTSVDMGFNRLAQFAEKLDKAYPDFKEKTLYKRRYKQSDILPLFKRHAASSLFQLSVLGKSFQGRDIKMLKTGMGSKNILLWSQMHGNEPTATQALFDIFNFLESGKGFSKEKELILSKLGLYFIPMLNPDGAEVFQRRNAQDIDMNRDALRLSSPEAQILKNIRDKTNAAYGFNLHDQNIYYTAGLTPNPATITFLAPAFNVQKDLNDNRRDAMRQIATMNKVLQKYIPGQVSRYDDEFMPTSLGDNIQKWGTAAILIESGGYKNDPEKQYIRKLNFIAILSALYSIALETNDVDYKDYFSIPENKGSKLFDLLIRNAEVKTDKGSYLIDVGIHRWERNDQTEFGFSYYSTINDLGDMSHKYGYQEIDAIGMTIQNGKIYPKQIKSQKQLDKLNSKTLLNDGYIYLNISSKFLKKNPERKPFILIDNPEKYKGDIKTGKQANFVLLKNKKIRYLIINGFVVNPMAR